MVKKPKSLTQKLKEAKASMVKLREYLSESFDEQNRCCRCFYFDPVKQETYRRDLDTKGSCHRYPNSINVEGSHWCGEHHPCSSPL